MMQRSDRDILMAVANELHWAMENAIDRCDYLKAEDLGKLFDQYITLCARLENKIEEV